MSLIETATLILTPNGYKEGKLYSVIPSNGNGDFTATRATTATRVNSAGLVELVPYNLVQYSQEFDNAAWASSQVAIASNSTTAPDGTLTAETLTASTSNAAHYIFQGINTNSGSTVTFSCFVKNNGGNYVQLLAGGIPFTISNPYQNFNLINGTLAQGNIPTSTIENVGNGWFRISYTVEAISSGSGNYLLCPILSGTTGRLDAFTGNGTSGIFIWGAQLVEGTLPLNYLRTETRLNIPRLDYSLGSCPNLLLEPQRTNLVLYSEQFDNAWWSKSTLTITSNTTISPSGILNADTLDEGTTSSIHRLLGSATSITIGSNNSFSLYVKKGTMRYFRMVINDTGDTSRWICAQFDLDTQTFTTNAGVGGGGTIVSASIQSVGNGWFRVNLVGSLTITGGIFPAIFGSDGTAINPTDGRGGVSYLGTNKTLFIWGAQLEAGAYATSYIPTTTASVTRNADSISLSNVFTNGLISASGGTWFVELSNNRSLLRDSIANGNTLFISDSSALFTTNSICIHNPTNVSAFLSVFLRNNGSSQTIYTTNASNLKIAIKWNGATMDVFQNGIKVVSAHPFAATNLNFLNGGGGDVPKNINQMALWATPLTDDQLELLTGTSFNTYAEMASFYNYTLQ